MAGDPEGQEAVIRVRGVVKNYGALRPLRLLDLGVASGEVVVVEGPDQAAAAVIVDLITGTTLPDAGDVSVAGRATSAIADHEAWLAFLEQFGIVNPRVVLLDALTVLQNLAVPLTLDLDPLPTAERRKAEGLAATAGLAGTDLDRPLGEASPAIRLRVMLGRALAHAPQVLLLEHPTLALPDEDVASFATDLKSIVLDRGLAVLAISADNRFGRVAATRALSWRPATGELSERRGWRAWVSR